MFDYYRGWLINDTLELDSYMPDTQTYTYEQTYILGCHILITTIPTETIKPVEQLLLIRRELTVTQCTVFSRMQRTVGQTLPRHLPI